MTIHAKTYSRNGFFCDLGQFIKASARASFSHFSSTEETRSCVCFPKPNILPFRCLFGDCRPSHVVRANFASRRAVGEREPKSWTRRSCAVSGEFLAFLTSETAWRKLISPLRCGPTFWRAGPLWKNCQPCCSFPSLFGLKKRGRAACFLPAPLRGVPVPRENKSGDDE